MRISRYLETARHTILGALKHDLRTEIAQDSAAILLGHVGRLALGLISSALLARGLGPEGLSVFSVIGAAMAIGITISDFGLRSSAIRYISGYADVAPERARSITGVYAGLKLAASLAVAGVGFALAAPIARMLSLPLDTGPFLVRLGAIGLLASALSGLPSTVLQAVRRFRAMVATQLANAALTVAIMAALFSAARLTVAPALGVGILSAAAASLIGYGLVPAGWRDAIRRPGAPRGRDTRELLDFSKWLWVSAIFSILASQLDLLLLNRWAAPHVVGLYALALNLSFKADTVNQSLRTVLLPSVSALTGRKSYVDYVRRSGVRSLLIGLAMIVVLPLARPFILTVYGAAYSGSVEVFYALMAVVLFDLFVFPQLMLAYPMNMPRAIAASDVVRTGTLLIVGSLLIPGWGLYGAVIAKLASRVTGAAVTGSAIIRCIRATAGVTLSTDLPPDADTPRDPLPPHAT